MKFAVYIGPKQHTTTGELDITHVIIGQRDRAKELVESPKPLKPGATTEEKETYEKAMVQRQLFVANDVQGRFALKPLEWVEGEEVATREAEVWKAEGWLNVRMLPVANVLKNG